MAVAGRLMERTEAVLQGEDEDTAKSASIAKTLRNSFR